MDDLYLIFTANQMRGRSKGLTDASRCMDLESFELISATTKALGSFISQVSDNLGDISTTFQNLSISAGRHGFAQEKPAPQFPWILELRKIEEKRKWFRISNELAKTYSQWLLGLTDRRAQRQPTNEPNTVTKPEGTGSPKLLPDIKIEEGIEEIATTISESIEVLQTQKQLDGYDGASNRRIMCMHKEDTDDLNNSLGHSHIRSMTKEIVEHGNFSISEGPETPQSNILTHSYVESAPPPPEIVDTIESHKSRSYTPDTPSSLLGSKLKFGNRVESESPSIKKSNINNSGLTTSILSTGSTAWAKDFSLLPGDTFTRQDQATNPNHGPTLSTASKKHAPRPKVVFKGASGGGSDDGPTQKTVYNTTSSQHTEAFGFRSLSISDIPKNVNPLQTNNSQIQDIQPSASNAKAANIVQTESVKYEQRSFFAPPIKVRLPNQVNPPNLPSTLELYNKALKGDAWELFNETATTCFERTSTGRCPNMLSNFTEKDIKDIEDTIKTLEKADYINDPESCQAHAHDLALKTLCNPRDKDPQDKDKFGHIEERYRIVLAFREHIIDATPETVRSPVLGPSIKECFKGTISYTFTGFKPYQPKNKNGKDITSVLRELIGYQLTKYAKTGYIYVYRTPGVFGYVKIGHTVDLEKRMDRFRWECKYKPQKILSSKSPIPHVELVEKLIHGELKDSRYLQKNCVCGKEHNEWFQAQHGSLSSLVAKWVDWIKSEPYDKDGTLKEGFTEILSRSNGFDKAEEERIKALVPVHVKNWEPPFQYSDELLR